jgi:hypothetical protein
MKVGLAGLGKLVVGKGAAAAAAAAAVALGDSGGAGSGGTAAVVEGAVVAVVGSNAPVVAVMVGVVAAKPVGMAVVAGPRRWSRWMRGVARHGSLMEVFELVEAYSMPLAAELGASQDGASEATFAQAAGLDKVAHDD